MLRLLYSEVSRIAIPKIEADLRWGRRRAILRIKKHRKNQLQIRWQNYLNYRKHPKIMKSELCSSDTRGRFEVRDLSMLSMRAYNVLLLNGVYNLLDIESVTDLLRLRRCGYLVAKEIRELSERLGYRIPTSRYK